MITSDGQAADLSPCGPENLACFSGPKSYGLCFVLVMIGLMWGKMDGYMDRLGQRIPSMEKKKSSSRSAEEDSTASHSCTKDISLFSLLGKSGLSLPQPRPGFSICKYDT